jgi:hypothetical protein
MSTFYLVQGDNGSALKATITRSDTGAAVDLTEATPRLKFKKRNTSTVLSTLQSSSSEEDQENGICQFAFLTTDLNINSGEYVGEIEITFDDGTIETVYEELEFTLREDY